MLNFKAFLVIPIVLLSLWLISPINAQTDKKTILVLGDSLSAAYGIAEQDGWVSLLQARLNQHYPDKYHVQNASISGETTDGGLMRLPDLLSQHQPTIVLVELGGNDGLRGFPPQIIDENLRQIVQLNDLHQAKTLLIGIEIPPNYGQRYTQAFRSVYSDLAETKNLAFVPFLLASLFDGDDVTMLQADGIHPTAAAQPTMLENVWPALQPLLQ